MNDQNDEVYLTEIMRMHDEGCPHHDDVDENNDYENAQEYFEDSILERQEMEDFAQDNDYLGSYDDFLYHDEYYSDGDYWGHYAPWMGAFPCTLIIFLLT